MTARLDFATSGQPALPRAANGRVTIGFLTANIHLGAGRTVWTGVADAAEQLDVNLFCFVGGGLHSASEGNEAQRNCVYELANIEQLDGLVTWASTVGGTLEQAPIQAFHRRFEPLPLVSLSQLEGYPALTVDSYDGMRAAIEHLIMVHGHRRLAFIRGPEHHYYAEKRYQAYLDALQAHAIPVDPRLITAPHSWDAGAQAVQQLLDERRLRPGVDFQALVTVSDMLASSALRALQARRIRVPQEIALVSCNDSLEGRFATPPLTSVALPFHEQGAQAVAMVLALIAGEPRPEQTGLRSRLVVRQSCGCPSASVQQAALDPVDAHEATDATLTPEQLWVELTATAPEAGLDVTDCAALLAAWQAELDHRERGAFLAALEQLLQRVAEQEGDLAAWQGVISGLRRAWWPRLAATARAPAEDLCGQARVVIAEQTQRAQVYQQLQAESQARTLREIGQALITTFDIGKLTETLAEKLPRVGMHSGYLVMFEHPTALSDHSRLILAYSEQGRAELGPEGIRFPTRQLLPEGLLPRHRRYSFMVEALYFWDELIGFVLLEIGPRDGAVYEVLRGHISSALKGALLFQEAQRARLAAEKSDRIKTRLLANVSHELRTPLNIIIGYTQAALNDVTPYGITPPPALREDWQHIQHSAEHQLRVVNDLLDLSRAEIDELDLDLILLDPRPLLEEAFASIAHRPTDEAQVAWRLQLPERLPFVKADPVRLRQILLNLLSNAGKFTERGSITLGAEVAPPHLHLWVADTGSGIPPDQQEHIFEPFVTAEHDHQRRGGIGLGLSITRRLVALHAGQLTLESQSGQGSTFHVYLPLPTLGMQTLPAAETARSVVLWISASGQPAAELLEFSQRQGAALYRLQGQDDLDAALENLQPAALAWDLANAQPGDWVLLRRLRRHPRLSQVPFILYGQELVGEPNLTVGLTGFIAKTAQSHELMEIINAIAPVQPAGLILIVDDDPQACERYQEMVKEGLPEYPCQIACDGLVALQIMAGQVPGLVVLDLMMPELDGFDVLDRMRADPRLYQVPVVVLSSKLLTVEDVKRLEQHARVMVHSKGLLSEDETVEMLNRALLGTDFLPQFTSALVKRALGYLHRNFARPLTRWEIANAVGVSEDYLSRVFSRELGLSPWDYLNRYRIHRAKELLRHSNESIQTIARQVGFKDQAYFSRVFHKVTGVSPSVFREQPEA